MTSDDNQSMAVAIGEIRGQLKELIHTSNNNSQKLDALGERVLLAANLPDRMSAIEAKVQALKDESNRRDGATSVIGTIAKSPAIGWLVGAAITAWAVLTGKVTI